MAILKSLKILVRSQNLEEIDFYNFGPFPYGVAFTESLIHAKQALVNIDFKNQL